MNTTSPANARISHVTEGHNDLGEQVRLVLVETEDATSIQRFVDGRAVSTTQLSGLHREDAAAVYDQSCLVELGIYNR